MVDIEKIVSPEQLSGSSKELVQHYGGNYIYVNKPDTLTRNERNIELLRNAS